MTLTTSPSPKLAMTFARRGDSGNIKPEETSLSCQGINLDDLLTGNGAPEAGPPISVHVSILPNADIAIGNNNVWIAQRTDKGIEEKNARLAQALDVAADLDIWVEFVKSQAASVQL
jgi:hypothetical protein